MHGILLISYRITEMLGTGYGDRGLSYICHKCGGTINHDLLRVAKFRKDTENLIIRDWPLGGTIIAPSTGTPVTPTAMSQKEPVLFPNRLVAIELRVPVLELINPRSTNEPTMNDVKNLIENAIANRLIIRKAAAAPTMVVGRLVGAEKLAVRKMMSRYWENTSIFALELGGAVIRQSVFVEKMHDIDWLRSPAARSTMERLLTKYTRFMTIIAENPANVAVPTLDVDLAWHTHQLSPQSYFSYTVEKCRKFIDHDDKIDEDALSTSFEWTSKTYQNLFHEVYSECTCWYCEGNSILWRFLVVSNPSQPFERNTSLPRGSLEDRSMKKWQTHSTIPELPSSALQTNQRTSAPTML
jgi:hypothetical protein